jgi:hypothetical protein
LWVVTVEVEEERYSTVVAAGLGLQTAQTERALSIAAVREVVPARALRVLPLAAEGARRRRVVAGAEEPPLPGTEAPVRESRRREAGRCACADPRRTARPWR